MLCDTTSSRVGNPARISVLEVLKNDSDLGSQALHELAQVFLRAPYVLRGACLLRNRKGDRLRARGF